MKINPLFLPVVACVLFLGNYSFVFADSCVTTICHQPIGAFKNPHQPVKDGDCLSCHQQKNTGASSEGGQEFRADG